MQYKVSINPGRMVSVARLVIVVALFQAFCLGVASIKVRTTKAFVVVVEELKMEPGSVVGGNAGMGAVRLNSNAPTGGTVVSLSSNKSAATVQGSVTIPEGSSSATFTVNTSAVTSDVVATLTARLGNSSKDANLSIMRTGVKEISVSPSSIMLGQTATGTVTLTGPAPAGTTTVRMVSGDKLTVQGLVYVSAGSRTATFPITTKVGPDSATYAITGDLNGTQQSAVLKIVPTELSDLLISPTSVADSAKATGTITLGALSPAEGVSVEISTDSANVVFSRDLKIPSKATTGSFTIQTYVAATPTTATLTAKYRQITKTATLRIAGAELHDFTVSPTTIKYGVTSYVTLEVKIAGVAGPSAVSVPITSSNTNVINLTGLTVKHNYSSATASVRVNYVSKPTVVTLQAKLNGVTLLINLTVNP